ncbi:LIM and calponin homology domains-containing protein 1-like isoform X10 [Pseudoliparis swirei]|uniref:LIM and calponin homology domains-containing protein 1-like isoform X10 n=1 Tax=Pseudoliparis swirei TaxID=2059687 RepID=UPI0024BDF841|nr:LIM and calponin homology domains-containing protein 1-like isoform X10 [Pseudoliparis swirei]
MASPAPGRDVPNASPRDEPGPNHPEPACLEAQKWIEAVTGKSFGDKDFRSGLENGILLCELLSAIKPGLVKKINRLPTPIAGLDNLSVFLRGCEEFGLKGSQLFDPGDLQDTSTRANLKDCNRKIKNVLNTVFWLGKAAGGCASYSGPTLNLKEFEGLLAQMKVESEDSSQMRSVRDSGYDCWDSERSDSLSPPRHTRDDSLDSLDSFGSRSQHSPSPDVANRGNGDGRGSDSEADAPSRRPDVRKDDMLARRTASSESRVSIPFNQFLPNRTNNSSYIPTPRRKPHTEEGEQRSHPQAPSEQCKRTGLHHKTPKSVTWAPEDNGEEVKQEEEKVTQEVLEQKTLQKLEKTGIKDLPAAVRFSSPPTLEEQEVRSPSPNIILRCDNDFLSSQKSAWDSSSDVEEEADARKVPDVRKDDLASRRAPRGPVAPRVHQFVPQPVCSSKDRERWEGIRRASQQSLQEKEISEKEAVPDIMTRRDNPFLNSAPRHEDGEDGEEEEGKVTATPNKQKDDLARRRAQSKPLPQRDGPVSLVSASMSQADMQKWKRLKMTEPSEACPSSPVCQACLETNVGDPFSGPAKAGRSQSKVVTFGGVTEIEQPVDTVMSSEGEEKELLRRLLSKATVAMPTIGLGSQLSERERSQVDGADLNQTTPPSAVLPLCSPESPSPPAEMDTRLAHYERRTDGGEEEDDDDEEEDKIPDPQKDDMMARRTGVFHKQSTAPVTYNRFLPLPSTKRCTQGEVATDAAPRNKRDVQAARSKELNARSVSMSDILNEEEVEHLPPLSQSRYERRHEQSNNFQDDDDHWQSELARWKNRRRSTSQELIKKEEERKRMEKRMKEEGSGSNKRKSIKTYKEILEEKERRESELCDAYRNAATPEEASVVLQRYALRFTISDATLDSLKLPRYPANPKQDLHPADREHKTTSPTNESSQPPNKLEPPVIKDQSHAEPGEMKTDVTAQQETSVSSSSPAAGGPLGPVTNSENVPPQSLEVNEPRSKPTPTTRPKQPIAGDAKPQPKHSEAAHVPPHSTRPGHALPSPPSVAPRPVPLLAAKPYCQPRSAQSGHKPVKMDGLVRVNGEVKVDLSVSTSPTSACHSPPEVKDNPSKMMEKDVPSEKTGKDVPSEKTMKDVPSEKTVKNVPLEQTEKDVPPEQISAYQETVEETPSPQTERSSSSLGSAISSLIGGRNCIITTTIVTELTHVEPHQPDSQSNAQVNGTSGFSESPVEGKKAPPASPPNRMQESSPTVTEGLEESSVTIETPMLNLAKRVNHWVWDPNEERKRLESWQQEQERLLQEQYQREQEKLKKEWEKAQLEVQEEGRKHNEEERRILEETVQPLNQTGFVNQQSGQMGTTSSAPEHNQTERGNVAPQQNGQSTSTGNEGQHVSKLHFLQDSACDGEPLMKQELWKTASLDRNPQLNQAHIAQRSESHGAVTNKQQPSALSPQPPSHSRSVSGKRLCSGCSQPLEKGAAMIIDTLGLFFHIQCFKCGACKGQLGDATAGTDVRIRNGLLSCHECYIASRGRGQPTTL